MTDKNSMSAPAGACGEAGGDVRPYPGVPVRARDAAAVAAPVPSDEPAIRRFTAEQFSRHHGTTLGLHSPGGPQS